MTIREEVKRRVFRATVAFYMALAVGLSLIISAVFTLDRLTRSRDPRMESGWVILLVMGGITAGGASILAGALHAYLMGREICCRSTWPVLTLGRALDRMK